MDNLQEEKIKKTVLIPVGYVPPLSEIQGFFKIKIRRPSLRVFL